MAAPKNSAQSPPSIDIDTRLSQLDSKLEKVRSLFEQYFTGVLKSQPQREHQEFKSSLTQISSADLKTTASKFKFQSIQSRHLQLSQLWTKTLRQIEEGTHKRELFLLDKKEEFEKFKQTGEQPRPPAAKTVEKKPSANTQKYVEALYEKMSSLVGKQQKLMAKEAFITKVSEQVQSAREKHPDKKVELRLLKNAHGKIEVKLTLQPKS